MANEELHQRGYLPEGRLKGGRFGAFEELNIGGTSVAELKRVGVEAVIPRTVDFPFEQYRPPKNPSSAKPDRVFLLRQNGKPIPVATAEHKAPAKLRTVTEMRRAAEQGLFAAVTLGAPVAATSDGKNWKYIDVPASLETKDLVYIPDARDFGPGVLENLLAGDTGYTKDPAPLAETVWQKIWQATKEEPKQCLLTFVEIFVLKFLSDNLPLKALPESYRFYHLVEDPANFKRHMGSLQLSTMSRPFARSLKASSQTTLSPMTLLLPSYLVFRPSSQKHRLSTVLRSSDRLLSASQGSTEHFWIF